jgi:hypothetical protein
VLPPAPLQPAGTGHAASSSSSSVFVTARGMQGHDMHTTAAGCCSAAIKHLCNLHPAAAAQCQCRQNQTL